MFEKEQNKNKNNQETKKPSSSKLITTDLYGHKRIFGMIPYNKTIKIILLVLLSLAFLIFVFRIITEVDFSSKNNPNGNNPGTNITGNPKEGDGDNRLKGSLPETPENGDLDNGESTIDDVEVEYLSFADFYERPENNYERLIDDYSLPLNVKVDAVNYYDVSRKFNLDAGVESFNQNGFAIFTNPYQEEFNDFYSTYDWLHRKNIPMVITSDFLMYYYHQQLNKVFKEIESSIFYDNLWEVNKTLYDDARRRYEFNLREKGNINDPVLEAQRLVTAYLAVSLEILKPGSGQVNAKNNINDESKFNPKDATIYSFELPYYLSEDVVKEVKLIREHKQQTKSPVLLYDRDYNNFVVPKEYQKNARLNNFYLTSKWLQSVFPLYHIDDNCPDCLLDQDDWRINMIASQILSQDISKNEKLKNKWARIYKIMSFFKGLREDLTYVNYRDSFNKNIDIESFDEWFDKNNEYIDERLYNLQSEISKYQFSDIRGGYDKVDESNRSDIGLKFLSQYYWPNSYIFNSLTNPEVGDYKIEKEGFDLITACADDYSNFAIRCQGFGLDVINLVTDIENVDKEYWQNNTNYNNYNNQVDKLKYQLNKSDTWQENNYWSNLNLINSIFSFGQENDPQYTKTKAWEDRLVTNSLGSWVNFQLESDLLGLYSLYSEKEDSFNNGVASSDEKYNYVEPNLVLIDNLIASTDMIRQMFSALNINNEVPSAGINLKKTNKTFKDLKDIVIKQNKGEEISDENYTLIEDLGREYVVREASDKSLKLKTDDNYAELLAEIKGVKIIALLRYYKDKPVLVLGPIFNYQEK